MIHVRHRAPARAATACSFLLLALHGAAAAQESTAPAADLRVAVPIWPNTTCAIMGKPVSTRLWVDIDYGRMYVCCKSCNKKIQRDPDHTYRTAYPATKVVGNTICPVSGEQVPEHDAPTVLLQGHLIALARAELVPQGRANAQIVLAKVNIADLVDVGNRVCPITGEAVQPNAFCMIGKHLVRLSSPACVKDVERDPAKALALARDLTRKPVPAPTKPAAAKDGDDDDGPAHDGGASTEPPAGGNAKGQAPDDGKRKREARR